MAMDTKQTASLRRKLEVWVLNRPKSCNVSLKNIDEKDRRHKGHLLHSFSQYTEVYGIHSPNCVILCQTYLQTDHSNKGQTAKREDKSIGKCGCSPSLRQKTVPPRLDLPPGWSPYLRKKTVSCLKAVSSLGRLVGPGWPPLLR